MRQSPMLAPMLARPPSEALEPMPKLRRCLRCASAFTSAWAGERICVHCKGPAAWRQGSPLRTHRDAGR